MPYEFDKKTEREEKVPAKGTGGRPSAGPQIPNSLIMRIMEDPGAEQEADRLSSGVTSRTPGSVMREMGGRLGADFSSVRFHSDSSSLRKGRAMGARAWAQGHDVYFGRGGFEPAVAAHELVHTVQQGAVKGNVSRSMPASAVQLLAEDEEDGKKIKKEDAAPQNGQQDQNPGKNASSEILGIEQGLMKFFATENGLQLYMDFEGKLRSLLNSKFKRKEIIYSAEKSVRFLIRACYRDYTLRDIMQEIVSAPVDTKNARKERARDYKGLIKTLSSRLTPADAEDLAIETGLFTGKPRFFRAKKRKWTRAYDTQADENGLVSFNPNNIPELKKVQDAIDNARTEEQAYAIFASYSGNPDSSYIDRYKHVKIDMDLFRAKLKHMARVVTDYPELKHHIGDMKVIDPASNTLMGTIGTRGGERPADIEYNKRVDKAGIWEDLERDIKEEENKKDHFHISPGPYHGTHELGHALASTLVENTGDREAMYRNTTLQERMEKRVNGEKLPQFRGNGQPLTSQVGEEKFGLPENDMLETVLAKDQYKILDQYNIDSLSGYKNLTGNHLPNQVALKRFVDAGATSGYGGKSAQEMFAEAVADVYSHGSGAKEMSKELVKEYESRQKKKVRDEFKENRKSWWQRLFGL